MTLLLILVIVFVFLSGIAVNNQIRIEENKKLKQ